MNKDKRAEIVEAMAREMVLLRRYDPDLIIKTPRGEFPAWAYFAKKEAEAALDIALKAAAEIAEDFSWQLPLYESREANEASDDAACATCEQIAAAILALTSEGPTHE